MGISVKPRSGGRNKRSPMSEMNVTPMIDVMLVLLVIFMVTAPMLTVGVKVNLPTANAASVPGNDTPIIVSISSDGHVYLGEVEVDVETLPEKLKAVTSAKAENTKIFVKGDHVISYGAIMTVMGRISSAGFKKVVLITELPKPQDNNVNAKKAR